MKNKIPIMISAQYRQVQLQPTCIRAKFYVSDSNPFFPIKAQDDRGEFYGLEFVEDRPFLQEIIHSKPGVIRGNHVHRHCTEIFTVLNGTVDMYLLCDCQERHLYCKEMEQGASIKIEPGIAHAIYTRTVNESTAIFCDNDPRNDRERVEMIALG